MNCLIPYQKLKLINLIFIIICAVISFLLLAFGVTLEIFSELMFRGNEDFLYNLLPIATISMAILTGIAAGIGFWSIRKENIWLLIVYVVMLFVLILMHFGFAIYAILSLDNKDEMMDIFVDSYRKDITRYRRRKYVAQYLDSLQRKYECCGAFGAADYQWPNNEVPHSCCAHTYGECTMENANAKGCVEYVYNHWENYYDAFGWTFISVCIIESVAIGFSITMIVYLWNAFKDDVKN